MDPKKRERILQKIRSGRATRAERLWLKQEGLCFYCWTSLDHDITKEHLEARSNGGSGEKTNLRVAHMACNGIVGNLSVDIKLQLHEIGRDKGADAFWAKAREFQSKRESPERNAYANLTMAQAMGVTRGVGNANKKPSREATHELTPAEAGVEIEKMQLGQRTLSKAEKADLYEEEVMRRKETGLPVQIGWREFFQRTDRMLAQLQATGTLPTLETV